MMITRKRAETLLRGGREGIREWNAARARGEKIPDLYQVNLSACDLGHVVLSRLNLYEADLRGANLKDAKLTGANLVRARLCVADLSKAQLAYADLCLADLGGARVKETNFVHAAFRHTLIAGDFSRAIGLDSTIHYGSSNITIATILAFQEELPERFLRGCGVSQSFIEIVRSYLGIVKCKPHLSCFISYTANDEDFARKLHQRMEQANLKVWFAPEDIKGGDKVFQQVSNAIEECDKLLIVISDESLKSGWVETELRKAVEAEKRSGLRKLFPVRLLDTESLRTWSCFDADSRKDLAVELREYFIPDFSHWQEHDQFEAAFARLLKDLKAETSAGD
jgi:uncharacterized protein YjbI with pentapeptide repeats